MRPPEPCAEAFEAEVDYIYKALRRHGIREADADDLAQEIFLVMWRRWQDYDPARPLRPWLAGIAFRVAYNHRDRIAREVPGGLIDTRDLAEGPEDQIASDRLRALVLQALSQVPEKQRTAMILHHLDGLGVRAVARATGVPLFTAYSRLRAGRRAFAAAVRRLHTIAGVAEPLPGRPEVLLAADRATLPPSARRRSRAVSRARAFLLGSPGVGPARRPGRPGAETTAPGTPIPRPILPFIAGVGLLGALALLGLLVRDPGSELAGSAAGDRGRALPLLMFARPGRPGRDVAVALASVPPPRLKLASPAAPGPSPARLAEGMVAYWRFDEPRATPAVLDLSGHSRDCQLQRIDGRGDRTTGPLGGALSFSGRAWLECPPVDPLAAGGEEMTIAVWIRRTGPAERMRAIVTRQQGRGQQDSFFLGFRADKLLLSSDLWRVRLTAEFPRDRWVHVAATRDGSRLARLYLDGVEVARARTRASAPPAAAADNPLLIGAAMNGGPRRSPSERLVGALDELVLYDRALPAEEVAALAAGAQPALSR